MISSMSECAVLVAPTPGSSRQQIVDRIEDVGVAPRSRLEYGYPGRGMWHEDRDQPVAFAGAESRDIGGEIHGGRLLSSGNREFDGFHDVSAERLVPDVGRW